MALGTTNITTTLVGTTIGSASRDVGSLCSSTLINKWSKYKPVIYPNVTTTGNWWKAVDGNCGLSIPQYVDIDSLLGDNTTWVYNKPYGTINSPYRLGDFRGYEHTSVIPFDVLIPNAIEIGSSGNLIKLRMPTVPTSNLTLNDIVGNKYFGVVVKRGTQIAVKTTSSYISAGGNNLSIDDCGLLNTATNIIISGFLTERAIPEWTSVADQTIWSLNAESNYAFKTTPIYAREKNTYTLGAGGFAVVDRTALVFNNDFSFGDRVTRTAVSARALVNVYELISVTGRATRDSDNVIVKEVNIAIDYQTSPQWLEVQSSGMNVTFNTSNGGVIDGLPALSPDDHYNFSWTFTFQQV